jgi:hypothetical protein
MFNMSSGPPCMRVRYATTWKWTALDLSRRLNALGGADVAYDEAGTAIRPAALSADQHLAEPRC